MDYLKEAKELLQGRAENDEQLQAGATAALAFALVAIAERLDVERVILVEGEGKNPFDVGSLAAEPASVTCLELIAALGDRLVDLERKLAGDHSLGVYGGPSEQFKKGKQK